MIVFEVEVNGRQLCCAGMDEPGVLSAILTWIGRTGRASKKTGSTTETESLSLEVGGLLSASREHLTWEERELEVGDEVRIRIVDKGTVDEPEERYCEDPAETLRRQEAYVRQMAEQLG